MREIQLNLQNIVDVLKTRDNLNKNEINYLIQCLQILSNENFKPIEGAKVDRFLYELNTKKIKLKY